MIYHGDCLEILKTLPDNSVDSIVTDPPYGLSFMGKKWDYDVPSEEVWKECLRVLKPGGYLLSFAGTRTQHRMAVRIEDAGFEIRDMIAWVYGSGFPKSLDVSKAIDKNNGETGRKLKFTAWMRSTGVTAKQLNDATGTFMGSHYLTEKEQPAIPTRELFEKMRPLLKEVPEWIDELVSRVEAEREVIGKHEAPAKSIYTQGEQELSKDVDITAPSTDQAKQWEGWGTALKPALEPITVARKPLIGTVAENVLTHGTGGLNIDGCRVGTEIITQRLATVEGGKAIGGKGVGIKQKATGETTTTIGRFPANLIHDGSDEVLECFPNSKSSKGKPTKREGGVATNFAMSLGNTTGYEDEGSAARFFYCAKASKKDRDEGLEGFENSILARSGGAQVAEAKGEEYSEGQGIGLNRVMQVKNNHPTVKPTALMRYLVKLVTPPGGTVLDPFTGSGSTGKACKLEGFDFIGIEREPEYVKIAEARIKAANQQPVLV